MGLFFVNEDKGKFFLIHRRKFTLAFSFVPLVSFFILFPVIYFLFPNDLTFAVLGTLMFLFYIFGMLLGFEGVYYGYFLPKKYEKQGKKLERFASEGIRIYK